MLSVNETLRNCFNDSLLINWCCCLQLIHFKLIYTQSKSKCMQIEDVSQQKDNDQWLFEEFLGKLVMTLMNFVSYHYRFIKVNKYQILRIL